RVMSMIPTSADSIIIMAATSLIGAIHVPINTAYVGHMLEHSLSVTTPTLLVIDQTFTERLTGIAVGDVAVVVRDTRPALGAHEPPVHGFAAMVAGEPLGHDEVVLPAWDETSTLLFTSGTTGASKAVIIPWY